VFSRGRPHKKPPEEPAASILRTARTSANRQKWIQAAIEEIQRANHVDRVGVWLEDPLLNEASSAGPLLLRGTVCDPGGTPLPAEWTRLSAESPLPCEELAYGKSVEYKLEARQDGPILGPLVDLAHVLWIPVMSRQALRGLLIVGAREQEQILPRRRALQVAEELGMLLDYEEECRLGRQRQADLGLWKDVQSRLSRHESPDSILAYLAETCTAGTSETTAGAVFALIGERKKHFPVALPAEAACEERLEIRAQSGDPAWAHSVEHGPLENFWRQAVATRQLTGAEADRLPLAKQISRIVAIPLELENEIYGVLVAGLSRRNTSLEMLQRLEHRAALAAQALHEEARTERESHRASWRKALLEASGEPLLLLDRDGFVLGWSRGARELARRTGSDLPEAAGEVRFAELFRPRDWESVQRWVRQALFENVAKEEDAGRGELHDGTPIAFRRLAISERDFAAVRLEPAVAESRPRTLEEVELELRQTLEWLDEGVVLFDETGAIRARNARFLQILGITAEEGSQLRDLDDLIRCVAKNVAVPETFAAQWRGLAETGEQQSQDDVVLEVPVPQVIERCTRAIVGARGKRLGRVEVYREMTARKMFQSRMVHTEKLAALGQRAVGIVHELSNPLTTILGNAQRLARRSEGPAQAAEVQRILEEAERAAGILRQLLHLSRETQAERRLVSLNELAERTAELQRASLAGSALRLQTDLQAGLPRVLGDFGQLQQALLNLLQNAHQAIELSGQGNTIGMRTARAGEDRVCLEVWDDGPGIPGSIQARIFDPFFTTKPPEFGTGLGLAIVLGFVRQHGGTLSVLSPPQGGARFLVELPVAAGAETSETRLPVLPPPPILPPLYRANPGKGSAGPPHVLVVEDELTVGKLIGDVLREEGMNVEVLQDEGAALERAEHQAFDLVICDLKMPGMDGQGFFHALVKRHHPLQERILFVTGDAIAPRTQAFLERHHLRSVAKPFRVEELSQAVHGMLSSPEVPGALPPLAVASNPNLGNG
jgi:signal transduction histidine kinase/ActR/RegA family two-component response regulator